MLYTITDTNSGNQMQFDTEDRDKGLETLKTWFDTTEPDIMDALENITQNLDTRGDSIDEDLQYLGLTYDLADEPDLAEWPSDTTYNRLISDRDLSRITRTTLPEALTMTGELDDPADDTAYLPTDLARQAYIKHCRGTLALHKAQAMNAKQLKEFFAECWQDAHNRWLDEAQAQREATRISGPTLKALRQTMGLEQTELADKLMVSSRTIRAWESGEALINEGATSDMWDLWETWVTEMRALIPDGTPAIFPRDTPIRVLRAAALLLGGRTFNTAPLGEYHSYTE